MDSHLFYKWGAGVDADLPRIVDAHDEFLVTESGEELVDAAAGAAVANLGHSVPGASDALYEQAESVPYVTLSSFSCEPSERLAEVLTDCTPDGLDTAYFVNSGSEAVEAAIKLSHAYHRNRGNPERTTVVSRWQSYHGATLGALSVSGNTGRRRAYDLLLDDGPKISPAYPYRWGFEGSPEEQAVSAAAELETTIRQTGEETVSAFIAEPVGGASIPAAYPHPSYYREVRRICDEYDVLFIADEIMTGFGRTGPRFAVERFDVAPDIMVVGKGLSSGYAPISATLLHDDIVAGLDQDYGRQYQYQQGHTFGGNPLSAAVAAHVVERYTDDVLATGRERGQQLVTALAPLDDHPAVGEVRHAGAMIGIELVANQETKEPFDSDLRIYDRIYREALERGVYVYPGKGSVAGIAGDHVMLSPPLTIGESSVEQVADVVVGSIDSVYGDVT